jgi:hypothetical protein
VVEDTALRDEMMKLRKDPAANAVMGGVITQQNAAVLAKRIGRQPTEGELYVAHFFGPHAAARVLQLAASEPNTDAAALFPEAARANRSVFYDRQGNARTIAGVRDELVRRYQVAKAQTVPATAAVAAQFPSAPANAVPARRVADTAGVTRAFAAAQPAVPSARPESAASREETAGPPSRSAIHSLFDTESRRGAISPVVAALWTPRGSPSNESGAPLDHLYREPRNNQRDGS